MATLRSVFEECQRGVHSHGKLIKSLIKIYNKMSLEEFWESFVHHLKFSMVIMKREPVVERTIEFAAKFSTSLVKPEEEKEKEVKESLEEDEEEDDDMHPFLLKLFTFLLDSHNAGEGAVRFRVCQLVNKVLNAMGEDVAIDDALYERLHGAMLQRLRDKTPAVRVQAVLAVTRLQDPRDNDCPVINAFLFLLGCDPSADVRRAVLSCIAASTRTLAAILERTRDTKDAVRRLAFQVVAEKVHVRALTIAQRERLLRDGLDDREKSVKDACCGRLLQAWLRVYEGNILELLKCLDVETTTETSEKAIKAMLSKGNAQDLLANFTVLNDDLVIPVEEMDAENVFYWRCLCQHFHAQGPEGQDSLDKILPTGTVFANYVHSISRLMAGEADIDIQLRNEFILQNLIELAGVLDLSDEVGRRNIESVLRGVLVAEDMTVAVVAPVLKLYEKLHPNTTQRINHLTELISDIRMPITSSTHTISQDARRKIDLKVASVRVELNQLREDLDMAIQEQDFSRAADIKAKVSELETTKSSLMDEAEPKSQETRVEKTDPGTILKCLTIATEMMQDPQLTRLTPSLQTLVETLILPGIPSGDPAVRNEAVKALGLCCLLNKELAATHLLLFIQVSQMDVETVQVTSLQVIFDLLVTFGLDAFDVDPNIEEDKEEEEEEAEEEEEEDRSKKATTACSIVSVLSKLLDSEVSEVRSVAAEGLCKLLLSGRIVSSRLLSRILLLWYNPITKQDNYLRHCLGTFFPVYAFGSGSTGQAVVEGAFLPTVRTLLEAPATSPLAEVSVSNVADLLIQLTDVRHRMDNQGKDVLTDIESCPHDNIALQVANEILSDPNSFDVRVLCKILTSLELCPSNVTTLTDLRVLADRMAKDVKDKQCLKLVEKFQKQVYAMLAAAQQPPPATTPLAEVTVDNAANTSQPAHNLSNTEENKENVRKGESEATDDGVENSTMDSTVSQQPERLSQDDPTLDDSSFYNKIHPRKNKKMSSAAVQNTSSLSTTTNTTTSKKPSKSSDTQPPPAANASSSEDDDADVFESPAPTRGKGRGRGRGRGGKAKSVAAVNASIAEDSPARSTRSTRKRNASKPLSDLKN